MTEPHVVGPDDGHRRPVPSAGNPPFPGSVGARLTTPMLAGPAIRRTTSIDGSWPRGLTGQLALVLGGRDVAMDEHGAVRQIARLAGQLDIGPAPSFLLQKLVISEPATVLDGLVGRSARVGFRKALAEAISRPPEVSSILRSGLEDVATVSSLSRLAFLHESDPPISGEEPSEARFDVCAGWVTGGAMAERVREGRSPILTRGAEAPALAGDEDRAGWHTLPPLAVRGFRRARRVDLVLDPAEATARLESTFRDTYVGSDGEQRIMHEYTVTGLIDLARGVLVACEALPHVLPGPECHLAAASTGSLVGRSLDEITRVLRADVDVTAQCTHLSDHLRCLVQTRDLLAGLRSMGPGPA